MNNEQLREEFWNFCDNDESGLEKLSRKGTDTIADWWFTHHAKEMESLREKVENLSIYLSDARQSPKEEPKIIQTVSLDDVLAIMREEI